MASVSTIVGLAAALAAGVVAIVHDDLLLPVPLGAVAVARLAAVAAIDQRNDLAAWQLARGAAVHLRTHCHRPHLPGVLMPSLAWVFLAFAAVLVVTACGLSVKSVGNIQFHDHQLSSPFAALMGALVLGACGLLLPLDHDGSALLPVLVREDRGGGGGSEDATPPGTTADPVADPRSTGVLTTQTGPAGGDSGFPSFDLEATLSPASGKTGDRVTISGSGCASDEKVEVHGIGPNLLAVARADSAGAFRATFTVPDWSFEGLQQIHFACVSSGSSGTGEFTLR